MAYELDIINGVIVADTGDILSGVEAEYQGIFGESINLNSETIQGKLVAAEASARSGVQRNNAEIANQINPNESQGTFLDSVCGLMDIDRIGNTHTIISNVEVAGTEGTFIPANSACRNEFGERLLTQSDITIPVGGLINVTFYSEAYGDANIGTVDTPWTIIDGTLGWGAATPRSGTTKTEGTNQQSDTALRNYRRQVLAKQGRQSVRATRANVSQLSGFRSMSIRENDTGAPATIDGVEFSENNGLWVCVDGSSDADIAYALLDAKACGTPWSHGVNNGTPASLAIVEPDSGQTYTVKWTRPDELDLYVRIYVRQQSTIVDPVTSVQEAIINWAEGGQPNEEGLVNGANVSAFELAGAVNVDAPGMYVRLCQVSTDNATWVSEIEVALWEVARLVRGNINVIVE